MCAPIAAILPWVAAAASIGGTALSVAGQIQSGRAAQSAADYNAAVTRNQAIDTQQEAERRAQAETAQAGLDETAARDRQRRIQAQARASLGISGQMGDGSAEDLLAENAMAGELDALTIRYGGQVRADALRRAGASGAAALNNQAALYAYDGRVRANQAYLGAGTTLLASAGSFATNFRWGGSSAGSSFRVA